MQDKWIWIGLIIFMISALLALPFVARDLFNSIEKNRPGKSTPVALICLGVLLLLAFLYFLFGRPHMNTKRSEAIQL